MKHTGCLHFITLMNLLHLPTSVNCPQDIISHAIQHPFTGKLLYPYNGACWRYQQDTMLEYMNGWTKYELREIDDTLDQFVEIMREL